MLFRHRWAVILTASLMLASGCVEKPASEPSATLYYRVTEEGRPLIDSMLGTYADRGGFQFAAGPVGNEEASTYTVHLVRADAQIIGVDPFVSDCFRLSFYKTLRIDRASDAEIEQMVQDLESRLRAITGVTMLGKTESEALGC